MKRQFVFDIISEEMDRQKEIWGDQHHSDLKWLSILVEEVGEASKAIYENNFDGTNAELIQCAAVICTWLMDNKRHESE